MKTTSISLFDLLFREKKNVMAALKYFTTLNALLVVFSHWTRHYIDLFLSTLVVFVLSSWIVFVYPKYIDTTDLLNKQDDKKYALIGWNMMYMHIFVHILPLVALVALGYRPEYTWKTWVAIIMLVMFILFSNTRQLYGIQPSVLLVLGMLTIIFYVLLK